MFFFYFHYYYNFFYFIFSFIEYFFIKLFQFFMFQDVSWIFWNVQCFIFIIVITKCCSLRDFPLDSSPTSWKFGESHDFLFSSHYFFTALGVRQACNSVWPYSQENYWHGKIGGRSAKKQRTWKDCNQLHIYLSTLPDTTPISLYRSPNLLDKIKLWASVCALNLEFNPIFSQISIFLDS